MNAQPKNLGKLLRITRSMPWREKTWLFGVTFLQGGHAIKLDVEGVKEGDADRYLILDALGLVNGLLALGVHLSVIRAEFIVRVHGGPMSVIGAMLELAYAMETEDRQAILDGYFVAANGAAQAEEVVG